MDRSGGILSLMKEGWRMNGLNGSRLSGMTMNDSRRILGNLLLVLLLAAGAAATAVSCFLHQRDRGSATIATAPAGFNFAIQADSHLDENTDLSLYRKTLSNIASEDPEFLVDLGDTFMSEKYAKTPQEVAQRYLEAKSFFAALGEIPLLLVNGNHDGEAGWMPGLLPLARSERLKEYPIPASLEGFSGNTETANYYSFVQGDVQFIVLDPFTFTTKKAGGDADGWNYTLGRTQYDWLKATLAGSTSTYRFVFIHNLAGGAGKDARGGAEAAAFFEWGGCNPDGSYGFDDMRPGWGEPIHQILVEHHVNAVFHGHDHFYAKQTLDGIVYQLVPQPGTPGNSVNDAARYSYREGVFLPSAGYLNVTVSASKVLVEYRKTSAGEGPAYTIPDRYEIMPE